MNTLRSSTTQRAQEVSSAMRIQQADSLKSCTKLLAPTRHGNLIQTSGQLYVSRVPRKAMGTELEQFMREAADVRTEPLDGNAIRDIEPALSPDYCSGLLLPDNGNCINPQRLVQTLAEQVA